VFSLTVRYEFGLGVDLNIEEAMRYYEASAKKKNAYSIQRIAMLRPSGVVTDS
jgi:TPR repeat protein